MRAPFEWFNPWCERKFEAWGLLVAKHPWRVLWISLAVGLLTFLGFIDIKLELRNDEVFPPSDSWSMDGLNSMVETFGGEQRYSWMILFPKKGGPENLLTKAALRDVYELDQLVRGIEVDSDSPKNLTDLCLRRKPGTPCYTQTPLDFFNCRNSSGEIDPPNCLEPGSTEILDRIDEAPSLSSYFRLTSTDYLGMPLEMRNVIGLEPEDQPTSAPAYFMTYILFNPPDNKGRWPSFGSSPEKWEKNFIRISENFDSDYFQVLGYSKRSETDAVIETALSNILLAAGCMVIMVIYLVLMLPEWRLGLYGIVNVMLGIMSGFAWGSALGLPITLASQLTFFTVMGIGADNVFIVTESFIDTRGSGSVGKRMSKSLSHIGVSISATTLTDVLAFATVSNSAFPMLRFFAITTAFALVMNYVLCLSFFAAILVILEGDGERPPAKSLLNRAMTCCCPPKRDEENPGVELTKVEEMDESKPKEAEQEDEEDEEDDRPVLSKHADALTRFIGLVLLPAVLSKKGQLTIIIVFLAFFAVSMTQVTEVEEGYDIGEITAPTSRVFRFIEEMDYYMGAVGHPLTVVTGEFDYTTAANQQKLEDLMAKVDADPYVRPVLTQNSWWTKFKNWTVTESKSLTDFYPVLKEYLATEEGGFYNYSIVFTDATKTKIKATQMQGQHEALLTVSRKKNALENMKDIMKGAPIPAYANSMMYLYYEMFALLLPELKMNLITAGAVVALVLLMVLPPPLGVIVFFSVIFTDLELLAGMAVIPIYLNPISLGTLVLALGLAVDYVLHIAHSYTVISGAPDRKLAKSLLKIGSPVVNGGVTTFLGIFVLWFSPAKGFQTFSTMFIILVLLGFLHGLVFAPAVISFLCTLIRSAEHERDPLSRKPNPKKMNNPKSTPVELVQDAD